MAHNPTNPMRKHVYIVREITDPEEACRIFSVPKFDASELRQWKLYELDTGEYATFESISDASAQGKAVSDAIPCRIEFECPRGASERIEKNEGTPLGAFRITLYEEPFLISPLNVEGPQPD
jgi:hypothetical protein